MRSKRYFLFFLFACNSFASFDYEGYLLLTHRSLNSFDYWAGGELEFKGAYLFNEKRDDFGLLISAPDKVILDVRAQFNQDSTEEHFNFNSRNIGIQKQLGRYGSLYLGDKILIWGKADKINPIDVWNAENFNYFLSRDKVNRKIARTMLIYNWKKENTSFEAVMALNDVRSYSQLAPSRSSWCNVHCNLFSRSFIRNTIGSLGGNTEFESFKTTNIPDIGARFSQSIQGHDFSFMLYHGADRFPYYTREINSFVNFTFTPYQEKQTIIGGDYTTTLGKFTLFAEGKYHFKRPYFIDPTSLDYLVDDDGLVFSDEMSAILGVDRKFSYDIYINLQLFHLLRKDEMKNIYRFGGERLITLLIQKEFKEKYQLEYTLINDSQYGDTSQSLELGYQKSDQMRFEVGRTSFRSRNQSSLFAGLDKKENYYINLRYSY